MNHLEFDKAMMRLGASFPNAQYSGERLKLIWEKCEFMPARSFERIVGNFVSGSRYAPLPKDFIDAAIKERQHLGFAREIAPAAPIECDWCNDGLVMEIMRKDDGEEFFCRCECNLWPHNSEKPRRWSSHTQLPIWAKEAERHFLPLKMFGERALRWKPPRGFDPRKPEESLKGMVERWQLKMRKSEQMWAEVGQ